MIILNVVPVGAVRMTQKMKFSNIPKVARYYAFRDMLRLQANLKRLKLTNSFKIIFYLPIPQSYKKRELYEEKPHDKKPDIDNLEKGFLDTLYPKDQKVYHIDSYKYYSMNPRIEVEFY